MSSAAESTFTSDLPRNPELERVIIGDILLIGVFSTDGLSEGYFTDEHMRGYFRTIRSLDASGCPIDILTVGSQHPGSQPELTELVMQAGPQTHLPAHIALLKDIHERSQPPNICLG